MPFLSFFRPGSRARTLRAVRRAATLPAPGPSPLARRLHPVPTAIAILVIIQGEVVWLLGHGHSAETTMGLLTATSMLAVTIADRLTAPRPAPTSRRPLM